MNKKSVLLLVVIITAVFLTAFQSTLTINNGPLRQDPTEPVPTVSIGVTVVVPGATAAPQQVPVTGGIGVNTLLIVGVLVIAGVAFLLALAGFIRRPSAGP